MAPGLGAGRGAIRGVTWASVLGGPCWFLQRSRGRPAPAGREVGGRWRRGGRLEPGTRREPGAAPLPTVQPHPWRGGDPTTRWPRRRRGPVWGRRLFGATGRLLTLKLRRAVEIKHRRRRGFWTPGSEGGGGARGAPSFGRCKANSRSQSPSAWPGPAWRHRELHSGKTPSPRPQPSLGVEGRGQRCFQSGPRGIALQFGSPPLQLPPPPHQPQHPTRSVPGSLGSLEPALHPGGRVRRARPALCASGSPGESRRARPGCGSRSGAARTSAGGGRARPERGRLGPHPARRTRHGGRRAGLGAAGAHKTRKVTREVARCLAVCLQRAPRLGTRLYNLTHNWP